MSRSVERILSPLISDDLDRLYLGGRNRTHSEIVGDNY